MCNHLVVIRVKNKYRNNKTNVLCTSCFRIMVHNKKKSIYIVMRKHQDNAYKDWITNQLKIKKRRERVKGIELLPNV